MGEEQTQMTEGHPRTPGKGASPLCIPQRNSGRGEFRTRPEDIFCSVISAQAKIHNPIGRVESSETCHHRQQDVTMALLYLPPTIASVPLAVNISKPSGAGYPFRDHIDNPERTVVNQGAPITEPLQVRLARWPRGVATNRTGLRKRVTSRTTLVKSVVKRYSRARHRVTRTLRPL